MISSFVTVKCMLEKGLYRVEADIIRLKHRMECFCGKHSSSTTSYYLTFCMESFHAYNHVHCLVFGVLYISFLYLCSIQKQKIAILVVYLY